MVKSRKRGEKMKDEKSILYVQTSGEPERQYSPLVLAQTAKNMDLKPRVYYLGTGLKILRPGEADKIRLGSFPSVAEMIKQTLDMGIEIYVCEASKQMLGWEKVDLIPGVKIVGAGTLNDLALEAGATMWF
jgi:predicted peroxiredoxin